MNTNQPPPHFQLMKLIVGRWISKPIQVVAEVREFFAERLNDLTAAGIDPAALCFDPGIGFGKSLEHNLALLRDLRNLHVEDRPLLIGLSRKSFIGKLLDRDVNERLSGTLTTSVIAAMAGAAILRVHDVAVHFDAVRMVAAVQAAADGVAPETSHPE